MLMFDGHEWRKGIIRVRVFVLFSYQCDSVGSCFVSRDFVAVV